MMNISLLEDSMNNTRELEDFAPQVDYPIDENIKYAVLVLRRGGIETFESCQGGPGHASPEPIVKFHGNNWEGFKAFSIAMNNGLPVLSLRFVWDINNGAPQGPWWEIIFRTMDKMRY